MFKKKIKPQQWVEALRSGKYTQARGALKRPISYSDLGAGKDQGYCCLGVYAEEAGLFDKTFNRTKPSQGDLGYSRPRWLSPSAEYDLIVMNDLGGKSFSEIADWIEENLVPNGS